MIRYIICKIDDDCMMMPETLFDDDELKYYPAEKVEELLKRIRRDILEPDKIEIHISHALNKNDDT